MLLETVKGLVCSLHATMAKMGLIHIWLYHGVRLSRPIFGIKQWLHGHPMKDCDPREVLSHDHMSITKEGKVNDIEKYSFRRLILDLTA